MAASNVSILGMKLDADANTDAFKYYFIPCTFVFPVVGSIFMRKIHYGYMTHWGVVTSISILCLMEFPDSVVSRKNKEFVERMENKKWYSL